MIASSPDPEPGHGVETRRGGDVFEFEDTQGRYITEAVPPEEVVRTLSTSYLVRILTAGTFRPIWVQLAREELSRRGINPPPAA